MRVAMQAPMQPMHSMRESPWHYLGVGVTQALQEGVVQGGHGFPVPPAQPPESVEVGQAQRRVALVGQGRDQTLHFPPTGALGRGHGLTVQQTTLPFRSPRSIPTTSRDSSLPAEQSQL